MLQQWGLEKFHSAYPLIAQQFVDDYHLDTGRAIDIGTGPGAMGIELARITNLAIYFVDIDRKMLEVAQQNFKALPLTNNASFIQCDAIDLPFKDNFADFIVSRGSFWFWDDQPQGLQEIYRVLKPGGVGYVGVGLGRYLPDTARERIHQELSAHIKKENYYRPGVDVFTHIVKEAQLPHYTIISEGQNGCHWVEIRKE